MNRPLALIEGKLALPNARLLHGLPPPFGVLRRPLHAYILCWAPPPVVAAAAQSTVPKTGRRQRPLRRDPLSPGNQFRFFYKQPKPLNDSSHFEAQLTEAKYYLEAGEARPRSSRLDHVLGAAIFAACSVALAWLLISRATHVTGNTTTVAMTPPPVVHLQNTGASTKHVTEFASGVGRHDSSAASPVPPDALHNERAPVPQTTDPANAGQLPQHVESHEAARVSSYDADTRRTAKRTGGVTTTSTTAVTRLSKSQIDKRLALSRSLHPGAQPSVSAQPEWNAPSPQTDDATELASLREWAAQRQRIDLTTRASVSTGDTRWNDTMTQRRITDNPDAFVPVATQR